jgi:hypothetical protein
MLLKALQTFRGRVDHLEGQVYDLPDDLARQYSARGLVEKVKPPKVEKKEESKKSNK